MRISDWSSDVCSSDLHRIFGRSVVRIAESGKLAVWSPEACIERAGMRIDRAGESLADRRRVDRRDMVGFRKGIGQHFPRSEEHTSELQSLMRSSYAVFCLKKKTIEKHTESQSQDSIDKNEKI